MVEKISHLPDLSTQPTAASAARYRRQLPFMHLAWGAAWLIGFGLQFLSRGPNDRPLLSLPDWMPLVVLFVLLLVAGVVTAVVLVRAFGRAAAPEFARRGRFYATAWAAGFAGLILTISAVTRNLDSDESGLVWGSSAVLLTAALNMAGSAIWLDQRQLRLGLWLVLINIVAAFSGARWQTLILAVAGGGASLVAGALDLYRLGPAATEEN
jgi:hypothetical protein